MNKSFLYIGTLSAVLALSGCGGGDSDNSDADSTAFSLDMEIPDSMTGGRTTATKMRTFALPSTRASSSDQPCSFHGADEDDPFRNGYETTKFMVSAIATWTCIADTLIEVSDLIPHDGVIYESENDTLADNYDPEEPTHFSVTDDSDTQTTVRLYYGYDRDTPPTAGADPEFYVSWNESDGGDLEGRLIIDALEINPVNRNQDDPFLARLDFNYTDDEKLGDMFLRFDEGNPWADGMRIEVVKDLQANPLEQVFRARGLMNMKAQFSESEFIEALPTLKLFAVSDNLGEGAAIAELNDAALPLEINANRDNHLGHYIIDKNDIYFFDADQSSDNAWDWIEKTFTRAEYQGGRTTAETGGTWVPFDPSLDMIAEELALSEGYFSGDLCFAIDDDCSELINAIFTDGFADQEPNQGSDPQDWRSEATANPIYLDSVFPNGANWDNAFDMSFSPIN